MNDTASRFRPRISLRWLLVVVAFLCLAMSQFQASRRLSSAQLELRKLRDEAGYITIEDESMFHAVALDSEDPNTWRWRLFIPKGNKYKWNIACEDIPQNSPPLRPGVSSTSNEPYWERDNEVLVTARLRQSTDGNWTLGVTSKIGDSKNQMSNALLKIPSDKIDWIDKIHSTDGRVIGSNGTAVSDPGGPIILLQRRPCEKQADGRYRPSANLMPGFMIWLD